MLSSYKKNENDSIENISNDLLDMEIVHKGDLILRKDSSILSLKSKNHLFTKESKTKFKFKHDSEIEYFTTLGA
ncbi:unnamed protein product [Rotaria magnacalcarata]